MQLAQRVTRQHIALLSVATIAQQRKWREVALYGRILTANHKGVPAASVWVTDVSDTTVKRAVTDGDCQHRNGGLRVAV
ncbi:MAG: hypothetical protein ACI91B_001081 [Planctomycetota bacterium]|jgi:hypothetical protein